MKQSMKRLISLILCFVMVMGLMPVFVLNADAAGTVLDAAIFCSDVHGSTSDLTSVLSGVKTSGVDYSSIGFVGDTCLTVANTTSTVQSALGDTNIAVMFSYAESHDKENSADIATNWDYSGEVEGVSNYYLVYTIRETDMETSSAASTAASAFSTWYSNLTDEQKALPIFIMSHRPLHARRNDNAGAATWYDAISTAAETSDIVFFWAHNHTGESDVDTAAYYVAKNGDETFTVYNGETVTPNFTYMNAGYINANNQNPARINVATTVQITADSLIFQDYTTSGEYSGIYAHNTTVTRDAVAVSDEEATTPTTEETTEATEETTEPTTEATESTETTEPTEPETSAPSEASQVGVESDATVPGYDNTVSTEVWKLTDTIEADKTYLIVNTNTAGSGYALLNNNSSVSTVGVTVVDDGTNTYIELDNANAEWTASGSGTSWAFANNNGYLGYTTSSTTGSTWGQGYTDYSYSLGINTTNTAWTVDNNTVSVHLDTRVFDSSWLESQNTSNDYYITGGSSWAMSTSSSNVYFYTPSTITTGSTKPDTTYHMDLTVDGNTVSDHAYTVTGVVSGTTVQMNAAFTATADGTTTSVDAPSGGSYTILSSSNTDVATLGTDGVLTFTGVEGETLIQVEYTWTENGQTYTTKNYVVVTAQAPVYDMAITDPESTQMKIGATTTLTANITADGTATTGTVTWTSSDESIATVDPSTGVVTGVAAGDVTITATYTDPNGSVHEDSVALEILDAVYTIEISEKVENEDGTSTTTPIEKPIVIKNVDELVAAGTNTHSVWAVITKDGVDMGTLSEEELANLNFVSSDETIATVDKTTGVVTFTGKEGTVQITAIYTYAEGKSVTDTVTFSISKETYTIPSDGTDDFPNYPDEGAIRFDKNAVAQGNFSETGIAKVELSMTGVPYTTGNEIDVVVMLDMTGSMSDNGMEAAEEATKAFVSKIVKNQDGTYNDNRVAVYAFNSGSSSPYELVAMTTIKSDSELETANTAIDTASDKQASGGTPFDEATKKCYDVLQAAKTDGIGNDRQQFCVFMSDGGPTTYYGSDEKTYYGGNNNSGDVQLTSCMTGYTSSTSSDWSFTLPTEYYTDQMKANGVIVYTVGLLLQTAPSNPAPYSSMTDSTYDSTTDSLTTIGSHYYFCSSILKQMATDSTKYIDIFNVDNASKATAAFNAIAMSILEAATDVVVEDKIEEHYTMNFKLPNTGVTAEEAGMSEFYIQAVEYTLDETTHERTGDPAVLENFTFNTDGTLKSHTVDGAACGTTCSHVTFTNGTVTAIDGTYFDYTIDENGDEFLTWNAEKLTTTELALQYFVYLDESAGYAAADQVDAGTYNTNEYATITYTNYLGNKCQQYFPIPSMTWMGAQVTYVFYLVNEAGQPVNRAGVVVPFAEAVYVTQPYTYDVTWNEAEGIEKLDAKYLAKDKVPDVYALYDEAAYYEILVYQTEGVDEETNAVNYNHFIIEGSSTVTNKETTKVFNTKAGTKYDKYGAYSATAGDYTSTNSKTSYTATVTTDIDYANTTVAFAVTWTPKLASDTVVVDYGLDVIIDVTANDSVAGSVVGVRDAVPSGVTVDIGTYTAAKAASVDVYIDANNDSAGLKEMKLGTATVESLTSVRFSLNEANGMQFSDAAQFYYEAEVNFYGDNNTLQTTNMYSSVTVIPATTIYYEDDFVTLTSYNMDGTEQSTNAWENSDDGNAVQAQDRPGASQISAAIDADNNYGYDNAYIGMSEYSMGSAAKITVDENTYGTAQFTFYGTGFDVISLTSYATGNIVVKVDGGTEENIQYHFVDTFYGYARGDLLNNTYTYTGGEWKLTSSEEVTDPEAVEISQIGDPILPEKPEEGVTVTAYEYEWIVVDSNSPNALYQVPVMKVKDLTYGKYTVTITASYVEDYDHVEESTSYDFYLDAIRIYDPANDGANNETIKGAYIKDGEYLPEYYELRNWLISAATFASMDVADVAEGIVFIDGAISDGTSTGAGPTASVTDYSNYGPNNELYLAPGQAVAFNLGANVTAPAGYVVDTVQIAFKSVGGTAKAKIWDANSVNVADAEEKSIATATDLYYDITELNGKTVVIMNSGTASDAILSVTNVKVTFKEATSTASELQTISDTLMVSRIGTSTLALTAASETAAEEETTITAPFTVTTTGVASAIAAMSVEPEETEPETTEPEETEPETTEPETTEPEETEPEETEPETTEPETTEPETTEPEATEPEVTEPETTEPETTEPEETEETEPEDGTGEGSVWDFIDYIIRLLGKIFG